MANITKKTTTTVNELVYKVNRITKFLFGKTEDKQKLQSSDDVAKPIKEDKGTATKIKPVESGDGLIDMLNKIYMFMNKNYEDDKLHREVESQFQESKMNDEKLRHKKLLDAIEKLRKNLGVEPETATAAAPGLGLMDIITSILDAFGGLKNIASVGKWFLTGISNPFVAVALGGVAASLFSASVTADPNFQKAFDEKNDPYGLLSATSGDAGLGASIQANALTKEEKVANDKKLEIRRELLKDAPWYTRLYGAGEREFLRKKGLNENQINSLIGPEKKAEPVEDEPATKPAPAAQPKASPAASVPASNKLNAVTGENNAMKVEAVTAPPRVSTVNNVNTTAGKTQRDTTPRTKVPPVRNQEPTFQSMIIYSTRVV